MAPQGLLRSTLSFGASTAFLLALAVPAAAQTQAKELLVGGPDTLIRRGLAVTSSFDVIGACGGVVSSMASTGTTTWIGDAGGTIYVRTPDLGVQYSFASIVDADAIAADGDMVFVGGASGAPTSGGALARYDGPTGVLEAIVRTHDPVSALAIQHDWIYIAESSGRISRTRFALDGTFETVADCGCPLTALTSDATTLYAADQNGGVVAYDLASFAPLRSFALPSAAVAMDVHMGHLLVGTDQQTVLRVSRIDGAVHDVYAVSSSIAALAMTDGEAPALTYCYGQFCPCGNDDPLAGCVNSTGRGARIDAAGSSSVARDDLALLVTDVPAGAAGVLVMGLGTGWTALGDGLLCVGGGTVHRFAPTTATGMGTVLQQNIIATAAAQFGASGQIASGSSLGFQLWFRDGASPCGSGMNTTNSARVQFTP